MGIEREKYTWILEIFYIFLFSESVALSFWDYDPQFHKDLDQRQMNYLIQEQDLNVLLFLFSSLILLSENTTHFFIKKPDLKRERVLKNLY